MAGFQSNITILISSVRLAAEAVTVTTWNSLSFPGSDIKEGISKFFSGCAREPFTVECVVVIHTVFTQRPSPQSGFGHPAIIAHENAGSRHQRLFQDYSSQEHEITL